MYLNILFLPLIGSLFAGFGGRVFGPKGSSLLSLSCMFLTILFSLLAFYEVGLIESKCVFVLEHWIQIDLLNVNWNLLFDSFSVTMLLVLSFISFLVHIYSIEYIGRDLDLSQFISYLSLFTFCMFVVVSAANFIPSLIGWHGMSLCSYLLINLRSTGIKVDNFPLPLRVLDKIGDLSLVLGLLTIYTTFEGLDYSLVFALAPALKGEISFFYFSFFNSLSLIGFLLFVGAVGKSAQLGLHVWLVGETKTPNPESIFHAGIVTAGVFLLVRWSPLLIYAEGNFCIITIMGSFAAFFAATRVLVPNDLKRVIAYSTCSQLAYIIFACGLSHYGVGVFHLANHAFFKALLFLGAGSVIHGFSDEQDLRKIGGLRRLLPFTYVIISFALLYWIGLPFLTVFYSKDAILVVYSKYTVYGHFVYLLGILCAFCTAFYSLRLIYLCFLSSPNGYRPFIVNAHESSILVKYPLVLLVLPCIFLGYLLRDTIILIDFSIYLKLITLFTSLLLYVFARLSLESHFEVVLFSKTYSVFVYFTNISILVLIVSAMTLLSTYLLL